MPVMLICFQDSSTISTHQNEKEITVRKNSPKKKEKVNVFLVVPDSTFFHRRVVALFMSRSLTFANASATSGVLPTRVMFISSDVTFKL